MVVGVKESSDLKINRSAEYFYRGKWRSVDTVYSDTEARKRRDIFPDPSGDGRLPESTVVRYNGNRYDAELSFRRGSSGQAIPVYQFEVENSYYK